MRRSDPLLTVPEAAEYLNCTERFIRRLVHERRLPKVGLGPKLIRLLQSDLDAFIAAGREEGREWRRETDVLQLHPRRRSSST